MKNCRDHNTSGWDSVTKRIAKFNDWLRCKGSTSLGSGNSRLAHNSDLGRHTKGDVHIVGAGQNRLTKCHAVGNRVGTNSAIDLHSW